MNVSDMHGPGARVGCEAADPDEIVVRRSRPELRPKQIHCCPSPARDPARIHLVRFAVCLPIHQTLGPVPSPSGQGTCRRSADHSSVPSSGARGFHRARRERHAVPESAIRARRAVLRWFCRVWAFSIWTRKSRVPEGITTMQSVPAIFGTRLPSSPLSR